MSGSSDIATKNSSRVGLASAQRCPANCRCTVHTALRHATPRCIVGTLQCSVKDDRALYIYRIALKVKQCRNTIAIKVQQ